MKIRILALYLIETPCNTFANREDSDQAALVRAARSGSTLFMEYDISDPTLVNLTSNFFVLCACVKVIYITIHSG